MNLLQITREQIIWLISFIKKIGKTTLLTASKAVMFFFLSQLFMILASFLPLKVVLLLASEGIPGYLTSIVSPASKNYFVVGFALAAVLSYGLYQLCNYRISGLTRKGSEILIDKNKKLYIFSNQENFAYDTYYRTSRIMAFGLMVLTGFILGLYIYFWLFLMLGVLILTEYLSMYLILRSKSRIGEYIKYLFSEKANVATGIFASVNFMIGFLILLAQMLSADQNDIILTVISIILMKQLLQQISTIIQDLIFFSRNRLKINALFYVSFHYDSNDLNTNEHRKSFIKNFSFPQRHEWMAEALSLLFQKRMLIKNSKWIDGGGSGSVYFEVETSSVGNVNTLEKPEYKHYLLKFFDEKQTVQAKHELLLFTSMPNGIPCSPGYIGTAYANENLMLVFEGKIGNEPAQMQWKRIGVEGIFKLWSVRPDKKLIEAYLRTHPTITKRLNQKMLEQVSLGANSEDQQQAVRWLMENWTMISEHVECLPLVIRNPNVNIQGCRLDGNENIQFLNWKNWSIEPIGCDNMIGNRGKKQIQKILNHMGDKTEYLPDDLLDSILLVSRLFEIELSIKKHRLNHAAAVISKMVRSLRDYPPGKLNLLRKSDN